MRTIVILITLGTELGIIGGSGAVLAQTDPGVRPGAINGQTGATATHPLPLSSVSQNQPQGILEFFNDGLSRFVKVESVSGGAETAAGRPTSVWRIRCVA